MKRILLIGSWDHDSDIAKEDYKIAFAAMRAMYPKAYIFNPYEYLYKQNNYLIVREHLYDVIMMGGFTHIVLVNDWWMWGYSRNMITHLSDGFDICYNQKPVIIPMTYELENQGREYLLKEAEAEHSNQKAL